MESNAYCSDPECIKQADQRVPEEEVDDGRQTEKRAERHRILHVLALEQDECCLLYTSDAADE